MNPVSRLTLTQDGKDKVFTLHKPVIDIGRGSSNDIVILDSRISRRHARISAAGDHWRVDDLDSANGTRVNGEAVTQTEVTSADTIAIGGATLRLAWTDAPPLDDSPTMLMMAGFNNVSDLENTIAAQPLESVVPDTSVSRLAIHLDGRIWEVPLRADSLRIGRAADNDLVLQHEKVSRHHAVLSKRGEQFVLADQNSSNGTFVDGERITEDALRGAEEIRLGGARLTFKPAFDPTQLDAPVIHATSTPRRPVVLVPGFMGSQLWRGADLLWPDVRDIVSRPEIFSLPQNDDLVPRGVVSEIVIIPNFYKQEQYTRLVHFLTDGLGYIEGKDLLVFAYDWRKDLREAARHLALAVEQFRKQLPDPNTKVTMLAHSMGCLVTRYYLDRLGGDQAAGRAILMGGPQLGIPKFIVAILAGLSVLPFGVMGERLRRVVSTFPSAYQTLPTYPCVFDSEGKPIDVYADERWLLEPRGDFLRAGLDFHRELSDHARVPTTCIFGYGMKTISKITVDVTPEGRWANPRFFEESIGDGTIPDASAILQGADIHPVQQHHEALYTDSDVKMRLKLELTRE